MFFGDHAFSERPFESLLKTQASFDSAAFLETSTEFVIYAGTTEFTSRVTDSPPNQPFYGTLVQPVQFKRSLLGSDVIGRFATGSGLLELNNTDGGYDILIQNFAIDGREIVVKIGRQSDALNDFYPVFTGTASDWSVEEDAVRIDLQDYGYKLGVEFQPNIYGGTGGADGNADLLGKRKPRAFGYVQNVSPPLVVPASLIYQVNDGQIEDVTAVYDRGSALTKHSDYATYSLLAAAVVPAGNYATCKALGYFRLGSSPSGTVTADVSGDKTGGTFVSTSAEIVKRIVSNTTELVYPDSFYLPSFVTVESQQPAPIGFWAGADDNNTVSDVLAQIMGGVGGWCGFRRSGKIEVGIFLAPTGVQNETFDRTDIFDIKRERLPSSLTPPPYRFRVGYAKNWTVQSDLASGVSAARKGYAAEEYRFATFANTSIRNDHPFAQDHEPIRSFFLNQSDAQTESERLLNLYKSTRALYRITLGIQPFALDLGNIIKVTYPRWDLTAGRLLRVVEITENAQTNNIEVIGYG